MRLLAVVIVMIAAVFGASAAQAHEGHAHHAPAAVTVSYATPQAVALSAKILQAVDPTVSALHAPAAVSAVVVGDKIFAQVPGERPCNGVCCSMGVSCCAPGLLPETTLMPLALTSGRRLVFSEHPAVPSLAREALPKPPRSFA